MLKITEIIAELDESGNFIFINSNILDILGYTSDELKGRNLFYLIHSKDWEFYFPNENLFTPETSSSVMRISRFLHKSGIFLSLEWILHIYPKSNFEKSYVFIANPISDESQIDHYGILPKESLKYNIFAVTDSNGQILHANSEFCAISKYTQAELMGQDHRIVNSGFHDRPFFKNLYQTIYNKKVWRGELRNRAKDGSIYWLDTILVPVIKQGEISHFLGIRTDITGRKKPESDLKPKEANNVLSTIFNNTPVQIASLDSKFNFILVNQAYADTCKLPVSFFKNKNHFDLFPHPENQLIFQKVVDTGKSFFVSAKVFEFPDQPEKGKTYWNWSLIPIKDEKGEVESLVLTLEEVTKQFEAEKILLDTKQLEIENLKKLEISESRYAGLLANLEAGVVVHAPDTAILMNNDRASELLGLSDLQMRGKLSIDPEWRFLNEDNKDLPLEEYPVNKILTTKKPVKNQILGINRPKTNDIIWVSVNGFPAFGETGELREIIISFIDITEQKKSRSNIHKAYNEVLQRQFAMDQHAIVAITNLAGTITYVNDLFCKISQYSREELIGKNHRIINSGYHPKEFFLIMYSKLMKGETWKGEIKNRAKDGSYYWVDTTIVPLKNSNGRPEQYIAIRTDITERKATEEKLKQREAQFHTIFDQAPLGIGIIDFSNGKFKQVNPKYCSMLGYSEKELLSLSFQEITEPNDLTVCLSKLQLLLEGNIDILSMEKRYRKKDNSLIWVNFTCVPMQFEKKDNYYHIVIVNDITESKKSIVQMLEYTENLKMLNATKDKFFNIIAHDLRNPFSGIINLIDIILGNTKEDEIQKDRNFKYLLLMRDSSKSGFNLLENLLQWARSQTGDISYYPTKIHFKSLVSYTLPILIGNALKKQITIETDLETDDLIYADESLVNTVLRNLLSNAIKFTHPNGKIKLSSKKLIKYLEIKIQDTGVGIESDNLDKLFRIDSKFTNLGTEEEKGTGLGLILCKEFVEKHGGQIWVESEFKVGTSFYFTLPLYN